MKFARQGTVLALVAFVLAACTSKDAPPADAAAGDVAGDAVTSDAPNIRSGADPTANDISNYKLDMVKMKRYAAAIKGFSALPPSDSAAMSGMSMGAKETMAQTIARIEANPVAKRVLRQAGLSASDYVWITGAYMQAAMTQGFMESSPGMKVPEGQNTQNLEFIKANRTDLENIMKDAGMMK